MATAGALPEAIFAFTAHLSVVVAAIATACREWLGHASVIHGYILPVRISNPPSKI
jgi:hypothetical protein